MSGRMRGGLFWVPLAILVVLTVTLAYGMWLFSRDGNVILPGGTLEIRKIPALSSSSPRVTRVIDGDTIELEDGRRLRYIGIDTPETGAHGRPVSCFGPEASAKNKELVEGKTVSLEKDISETDRYGRLLRYVWIGDVLINEALVAEGYAQVSTYPPDVKYQDRFLAAQEAAREQGKGLWAACGGTPPIYYANCAEAKAAGAAPIYRGQPGYRPGLDRDNDGIACE